MTPWFDYLWPSFSVGLVAGAIGLTLVWRRKLSGRAKWLTIDAALAAAALGSLLWSGPLGGADRFRATVEPAIARTLAYYEMDEVQARLGSAPMTRQVTLSGTADDFQRAELVRIIGSVPGVSRATWAAHKRGLPILVEGALAAIAGFLFGAFLAYLLEWHRRYNAQWNW